MELSGFFACLYCRQLRFSYSLYWKKRCIMLAPTEELASLPAQKKQIAKIQQIDNVPVVLELAAVSKYQRKSLIENNIPFVTEKQIFLPFIGTMLTDEKEPQKLTGKFVYSTQQLFLLYLYSRKNDYIFQKPERYCHIRQ